MKKAPANLKKPLRWRDRLRGARMIGDFAAVKVETIRLPFGDWRWTGSQRVPVFAYYCPTCGDRLQEGPRGGAACNVVCHRCKANFGSLPNNEHE